MISSVVVGVDGQEGGWDAIALARRLAPEARLTLVSAYGRLAFPPGYSGYGVTHEGIERAANEMLERAVADHAPGAEHLALPSAAPGFALHHTAIERGARLIVVGSAHRGAIGRVLLGDDSRATIHGAPCAVAVAPRGFAKQDTALRNVVVGYNGSADSRAAVEAAAGIARERGVQLRVIAVAEAPSHAAESYAYALNWPELTEASRMHARHLLDALLPELDGAEGEVVTGHAAQALQTLAGDGDVLVVGSRGWGALRRVVLGSTSDRLVHHARCPVLVVPRPADVAEEPSPLATGTPATV